MNDSTVNVRPVVRADYEAWKPMWDGYNEFYGRHGAAALPDAVTQSTWSRFFDPAEPMHALVAESNGQILGMVHYLFHRTTVDIALTCYLQDLFTSASARGAGVGRALIEAVHEQAQTAGSARVYWQTQETNETAMRLYNQVAERSGFIVYRMPC